MNNHIQFNLNQEVRVRLTEKGRSHLYKMHCEMYGAYSKIVSFCPPTEVNGWTEFQLWDLIGKFGEFCQAPGFDLPFSPDIELIVEDGQIGTVFESKEAYEAHQNLDNLRSRVAAITYMA
jgi:hypothetical protein